MVVKVNKKEFYIRYAGVVIKLNLRKERLEIIEIFTAGCINNYYRIQKEEDKKGLTY